MKIIWTAFFIKLSLFVINFSLWLITLLALAYFILSMPQYRYLDDYTKDIRLHISLLQKKAIEVEKFKLENNRFPTNYELNECINKFCMFSLILNFKNEEDYEISYWSNKIPFTGYKMLESIMYIYDPKTGKSNNDYRNTFFKMFIVITFWKFTQSLFFILPLIIIKKVNSISKRQIFLIK